MRPCLNCGKPVDNYIETCAACRGTLPEGTCGEAASADDLGAPVLHTAEKSPASGSTRKRYSPLGDLLGHAVSEAVVAVILVGLSATFGYWVGGTTGACVGAALALGTWVISQF